MSLTKKNRLKRTKDIQQVFYQGDKHFAFPLKFVWVVSKSEAPGYRIGVSVAKRNLKRAVDRILIKRRMKEALRLNIPNLNSYLMENQLALDLMMVYVSKSVEEYTLIEKRISKFLDELEKNIRNTQ